MRIKNVAQYLTDSVQNPKGPGGKPNGEEKAASTKEAGGSPDRVVLSKDYKEMAQVQKVMMSRSDVRTDKVDALRNLIDKGSYEVDPEKVAGRMFDEII